MRAANLLRQTPGYRADVFSEGLRRHGFRVSNQWERKPGPRDVLLIWNRSRAYEHVAALYEREGARVIVAENGYIDRAADGSKFYALALGAHNGAGSWFVGDAPRFDVRDEPWRTRGSKVLILPQRGIGSPGVAMASGWLAGVQKRLEAITDREFIIRRHPGHQRAEQPLDFTDVWCAVTWGSGAGIKAIRAGVPVFHELECWIGAPGAALLAKDIERCHTPDRRLVWTRVTWAQWLLTEIGSGEAFDRLLNEEPRGLFRSSASPVATHCARDGAGHLEGGRARCPQVVALPPVQMRV